MTPLRRTTRDRPAALSKEGAALRPSADDPDALIELAAQKDGYAPIRDLVRVGDTKVRLQMRKETMSGGD